MALTTIDVKPDPTLLRLQRIYSRRRSGVVSPLCLREKDWALAKWGPYGWQNVARFATYHEAYRALAVMNRAGIRGAISSDQDGATLRCFEVRVNRLRQVIAFYARYLPEIPELRTIANDLIDQEIVAAHVWAARRGRAVAGRLQNGLLVLHFAEPIWEGE